jgi:hypothetical protein
MVFSAGGKRLGAKKRFCEVHETSDPASALRQVAEAE